MIVVVVLLAAVIVRVGRLQGSQGAALIAAGQRQRTDVQRLAADRGVLLDRNGAEMALSIPQTSVWVDPRLVSDPTGMAHELAPALGVDEAKLASTLATKQTNGTVLQFAYLARGLTDVQAAAFKELLAQTVVDPVTGKKVPRFPGVSTVSEPARFYPGGDSGRSVLGTTDDFGQGLKGIEAVYDQQLAGTPGELRRERDKQGRTIPVGSTDYVAPTQGDDLMLTLDRSLQYFTEQALLDRVNLLSAKGGVVIVMVPQTGDILAMASVSTPAPDSTNPTPAPRLTRANSALVFSYEPGSVNKVITASAAVEEGIAQPDTLVNVPAQIKACPDKTFLGHGQSGDEKWSLSKIITQSSNTGTMTLAYELGKDRLDKYLRSFGLGTKTSLSFPDESSGILMSPRKYTCSSLPTIAIGQGVSVTAQQMIDVFSTIANGGKYQAPRLVSATIGSDGQRQNAALAPSRRVVSQATARAVTTMLTDVVTGDGGTGHRAAIDGYVVAGKTGTAQKAQANGTYLDNLGHTHYFSSFVGFAPAEDPAVVVLAAIDEPDTHDGSSYYASVAAAPLFHTITQEALRVLKVPPRADVVAVPTKGSGSAVGDEADAGAGRQ